LADCPGYVRPGGASGCYEYYEDSVEACEKSYEDARSCGPLAPCIVSAERNDELPTCELLDTSAGGQGGASPAGGADAGGADAGGASPGGAAQGGAGPLPEAGAPAMGGAPDLPAGAGAGGS
jgi:hypothetical protein